MKALTITAAIIVAASAGFIVLHYLGYNPYREYQIGAELNRLPMRDVSISCVNKLCTVEAENQERGYRFSFNNYSELKEKVAQIRTVNKNWPNSKSECIQTRADDQFEWCEM